MTGLDFISEMLHGKAATTTSTSVAKTDAPITFLPQPDLSQIPVKQRKKIMKQWMEANGLISVCSNFDKITSALAYLSLFLGLYGTNRMNPFYKSQEQRWVPEHIEQKPIYVYPPGGLLPLISGYEAVVVPGSYKMIDVVDEDICLSVAAALTGATWLCKESGGSGMAVPLGAIVTNVALGAAKKGWDAIF